MRCSNSHWLLWGVLLLVATLPGCGTESGPAPGKIVRIDLPGDPSSLSLIGKTDRNAARLAAQLTDSLVQYDAELILQPRLAESWEFSADRLTLTFRLRPGVLWHDGRPVTADDVVFTVNKVREPALANRPWAPLFRDLTAIEAVDELTVRATYGAATPDVLEGWQLPILPRHLAEADEDLLTGEFVKHPVGCGPYRFVRYVPGREIVLEANASYWDGAPSIDRLLFKIYPDQRTRYQALLSGELDVATLSSNLWKEAQTSSDAAHLSSVVFYQFRVWCVFWNQDGSNPFFDDPRVRRAMVLALDRDAFTQSVLFGLARAVPTTWGPDPYWADPSVESWSHDPVEAARLLDEAGWRDADGDGVRERDGRPFEFTLTTVASTQKLADHLAAWQQQSLAELGVRMKIESLEWQTLRERRDAKMFEAVSFSLFLTRNPDQFELYHSTAKDGGYNFYGLDDPEVDRLLERGRQTFEPAARREVYFELQRRLHDLEPLTTLFNFATPVLFDRRLEGVRPSPLGHLVTVEGPRSWHWTGDAHED
jgi:peptide/nickel transport system substrate-binding protein